MTVALETMSEVERACDRAGKCACVCLTNKVSPRCLCKDVPDTTPAVERYISLPAMLDGVLRRINILNFI